MRVLGRPAQPAEFHSTWHDYSTRTKNGETLRCNVSPRCRLGSADRGKTGGAPRIHAAVDAGHVGETSLTERITPDLAAISRMANHDDRFVFRHLIRARSQFPQRNQRRAGDVHLIPFRRFAYVEHKRARVAQFRGVLYGNIGGQCVEGHWRGRRRRSAASGKCRRHQQHHKCDNEYFFHGTSLQSPVSWSERTARLAANASSAARRARARRRTERAVRRARSFRGKDGQLFLHIMAAAVGACYRRNQTRTAHQFFKWLLALFTDEFVNWHNDLVE